MPRPRMRPLWGPAGEAGAGEAPEDRGRRLRAQAAALASAGSAAAPDARLAPGERHARCSGRVQGGARAGEEGARPSWAKRAAGPARGVVGGCRGKRPGSCPWC